ncbi:MAG: hypothetical protein L6420_10700 [Elusimicrobia bacterium]|nr:hypothetical protein [Elusimicrobiota bacterium]
MKRKDLIKKIKMLGYPLLETEGEDANLTLAEVVESNDPRLWEGFPIMLATACEKGVFKRDLTKSKIKGVSQKKYFDQLVMMSLALYESLDLKFAWIKELCKAHSKEAVFKYVNIFNADGSIKISIHEIPTEKMKSVFNMYFSEKKEDDLSDLLSTREEFSLEYAMSQIFTGKQKEIFLKKFRQEKLTKTEKEYFSRVIKKKAYALANPELHRLARKLLES